jgi:hypothetical protein
VPVSGRQASQPVWTSVLYLFDILECSLAQYFIGRKVLANQRNYKRKYERKKM